MTEQKSNDKVIFYCYVFSYEGCRHSVEWVYEGKENISSVMEISSRSCNSNVAFETSHFNQKSILSELLFVRCKVTDEDKPSVLGWENVKTIIDLKLLLIIKPNMRPCVPGWSWWYVYVTVGLSALLIIIVIISWKKMKGRTIHKLNIKIKKLNVSSFVCIIV